MNSVILQMPSSAIFTNSLPWWGKEHSTSGGWKFAIKCVQSKWEDAIWETG